MKIIQVINSNASVMALCDDGSLWQWVSGQWHQFEPIPQISKDCKMLVTQLNLPPRVMIALNHAGILYVDQLVRQTKNDLILLPRVGNSAIFEIEVELNRLGLRLAQVTTYREPAADDRVHRVQG